MSDYRRFQEVQCHSRDLLEGVNDPIETNTRSKRDDTITTVGKAL